MSQKKAVIVLSGGLDSATCFVIAKSMGFDCYAITFSYGQRSSVEIASARAVCREYGARDHILFDVDIGQFKHSALTDRTIAVPGRAEVGEIPVTYVPARNTIFLSIAVSWGETLGARDIFFGANAVDYSGYPDCRPEYVSAFEAMVNLGTKSGVNQEKFTIHAPLMAMTKSQIIARGVALGLDYGLTCSCYDADADNRACGQCESCRLRREGFENAGISDPTRYR